MATYRVYVCFNRDCKERGSALVWKTFEREVALRGLADEVELIVAGCQGRCDWGPNVTVHPGATKYSGVDAKAAEAITERHLVGGEVATEFLFGEL